MPVIRLLSPRLRLLFFILLGAGLHLVVVCTSPEQAPVMLYKLALTMLAAIVGLFFDLAAFPYAAPHSYLDTDWKQQGNRFQPHTADFPVAAGCQGLFVQACLRRTLIIAAFTLAVTLGL